MTDLEAEIAAAAPPGPSADPDFVFLKLAENLASAMIAAAEAQVEIANEALAKARDRAAAVRELASKEASSLAELKARFARYGGAVLDAHSEFSVAQAAKPRAEPPR